MEWDGDELVATDGKSKYVDVFICETKFPSIILYYYIYSRVNVDNFINNVYNIEIITVSYLKL